MITFLRGQNFSGRSKWMEDRRGTGFYPKFVLVNHSVDTTYTGLTWTVREELQLVSENSDYGRAVETFGLKDFLDRELHVLSGGESVRTALAVAVLHSPDEIQIDCALEQVDDTWRNKILDFFHKDKSNQSLVIADNHLINDSIGTIKDFPITNTMQTVWSRFSAENALSYVQKITSAPISIKNLSFRYKSSENKVFDDINYNFLPGNLYFFVGANGSGKTTLVKLLAGALTPQIGDIFYAGKKFNPRISNSRYASLAFQNPDYQWVTNTVEKEIDRLRKMGQKDKLNFLEAFGIDRVFLKMSPIELPFVVKKRVSVGLAALSGKQWLILDEPTLGQDELYRNNFANFVKSVLKMQVGIIVISHDSSFRKLFPEAKTVIFKDRTIATE